MPLPDWFWTHHDARICRVPVYAAADISEVPFFIRYQARVYHEALREARTRLAQRNKYYGVTTIEW